MNEIEQAIKILDRIVTLLHGDVEKCEQKAVQAHKAMRVAMDALQEKLERLNPKPLTLDELISSRNEPLYMKDITNLPFGYGDKWFICDLDKLPDAFYNYGKTWLAYRHKPDLVNVNKIEHIGEANNEGE